jgi:Mn-dependent DtxR family transcriptional regulator
MGALKLSDAQVAALAELHDGKISEIMAMLALGRTWRQTMRVLEDRGLVRFQPYADHGRGLYTLTPDGRVEVRALLKSGLIVLDDAPEEA